MIICDSSVNDVKLKGQLDLKRPVILAEYSYSTLCILYIHVCQLRDLFIEFVAPLPPTTVDQCDQRKTKDWM